MQIDAFTVLLFALLVKWLLGGLFLAFWLTDRKPWFAWYSAGLFVGSVGAAFLLVRGFEAEFAAIGLGAASLIAATGCAWQGARAFGRRKPLWLPLAAAPAAWLLASLSQDFLDTLAYRVILSSVLMALLLGLTAFEFWRGREEQLPSRGLVVLLFASMAVVFLVRIPLIGVIPAPFGALPLNPIWVAAFHLAMFFHTIVLAVLVVALDKERLELEQRTRAQTDSLTGALNRRGFMSRGHRLILRHQTSGDPICLLFLDLDHFKALNDRFGHSGGDDVLIRFVTLVHQYVRPGDFLFRIGGEEFYCLLPDTTADGGVAVAERIRREFEAAMLEVAGTQVRATVSIGGAATETCGYDVDVLVRRADMAAYAAKRQGRNQVVRALPDAPLSRGEPVIAAGTEAVPVA